MFGITNRQQDQAALQPTAEDIARLAGFETLDSDSRTRIATGAILEVMSSGCPPTHWFDDHQVFLRSGEIQMRSTNGHRHFLSSVSPPARFPLPPPESTGIRCVEAATFIRIPLDALNQATVNEAASLPRHLASLRRLLEMKLASGEIPLPTMPDLAVKLNSAMRAPDSRHDDQDIAKLIQLDPALASKVIHVVNSAAFRFAKKASTVQQAVTRLGRDRVRNIAISFLMRHAFHTESGRLRKRAEALWLRSCHVAAVSFTLARHLPNLDPDRAMLAGLIHEIGALPVLGLANQQPTLFADSGLLDGAIDGFGKPLGQHVLQRWSFDDEMLEVVRQAGRWERIGCALPDYADVVNLAQLHAEMGRPGAATRPPLSRVPAFQKLELGKLTPNKSIQAIEDAGKEIAELRRILARAG